MFANVAKVIGYSRAPKASFMLMHPVKGTRALVAARGVKGLVTSRAGATLLGMVLVPLGVAAFRARNHRG